MELNQGKLAQRYATALIQLAKKNMLKPYIRQLRSICDLFAKQADLDRFFSNPLIPVEKKQDLVHDILAPMELDDILTHFMDILVLNGRIALLDKILFVFTKMSQDILQTATAIVYSAYPLDAQTQKNLKKHLFTVFNRDIELDCKTDPAIIGGLKINLDNQVIDYSIKGELERIREVLKQEG